MSQTQTRPIVFIAHSLGGIVLKSVGRFQQIASSVTCWQEQALIHSARQGPLEERRSIKLSTYGILFMGTPQGASGGRLGELMLNVASIFVAADDKILKHLDRDSEWLQQQLGQYAPISRDFVTKFAYEMLPTRIAGENSILVSIFHSLSASALSDLGRAKDFGRRTRCCRCRTCCHTSRPP